MSSSASYPMPTVRFQGFPEVLQKTFSLINKFATMPWHVFILWLSWCSTILFSLLSYLGARPHGFIPDWKIKELNSVVEHMSQREDIYRKTINDMQQQLEAKDSDRRKALRRLKTNRAEMDALTEQLDALQREYAQGIPSEYEYYNTDDKSATTKALKSSTNMHISMVIVTTAVWVFCKQEHPSIHWKLLFALFSPLCWTYLTWATDSTKKEAPLLMLGLSWFLTGFVASEILVGGSHASVGDYDIRQQMFSNTPHV